MSKSKAKPKLETEKLNPKFANIFFVCTKDGLRELHYKRFIDSDV